MSPVAVFVRTLLKSSAIFIGAATIFLNPALEWRTAMTGNRSTGASRGTAVSAGQAGSEAAIDGLIALLEDTDAGVRRAAVNALAHLNSRRAVPALREALKEEDASIRRGAATAIAEISGGHGPHSRLRPHPRPRPDPSPSPNPNPSPRISFRMHSPSVVLTTPHAAATVVR